MTETQTETPAASAAKTLDIDAIMKAIPHRYPFLLVDKVAVAEDGKSAVGTKCVTINEPFFQGHFPGHPIMPGVLIVEAMAQTACVLLMHKPGFESKMGYFLGIESAKFRLPVLPGSVLSLKITVLRAGSRAGKFRGEAYLENGKLATEAEMSFAIVDKDRT